MLYDTTETPYKCYIHLNAYNIYNSCNRRNLPPNLSLEIETLLQSDYFQSKSRNRTLVKKNRFVPQFQFNLNA